MRNVYLIGLGRTGKSTIISKLEERGELVSKEYVPRALKKLTEKYKLSSEHPLQDIYEKGLVLEAQTYFALEFLKSKINSMDRPIFFDRGLIDVAAYSYLYGKDHDDEDLLKLSHLLRCQILEDMKISRYILVPLKKEIFDKSFGTWYRNDKYVKWEKSLEREKKFIEYIQGIVPLEKLYVLQSIDLKERIKEVLEIGYEGF